MKFLKINILFILLLTSFQTCFGQIVSYIDEINNNSITVNSNQTIEKKLILINESDEIKEIQIGVVDSVINNLGYTVFKLVNDEQTTVGKWFTIPEKISLKPGEKKSIPIKISIPANQTPGVYLGGLSVQVIKESKQLASSGAISLFRTIKGIYINIPGEKKTSYKIEDIEISDSDKPQLLAKIANLGNTFLKIEISGELNGNNIFQNYQLSKNSFNLPGLSSNFISSQTIDKIAYGLYTAEINITIYEFDPIKNTNTQIDVFQTKIPVSNIPYQIIYLILGILIFALIILLIKHLLNIKAHKLAEIYLIQPNDNIVELGAKFGVKWQKLAKFNKLKVPYFLKAGDKLLIPPSKNSIKK